MTVARREIRSYVIRSSRLGPSKSRTFDRLHPVYGVDLGQEAYDWDKVFPGCRELHVEVGIGSGEAMVDFARSNPCAGIVGFEVYPAGVASALGRLEGAKVENARVAMGDATLHLRRMFRPGALSSIRVFYPDPWPKKRHHKRRLVNQAFVDMSAALLRQGGVFHFATDCKDYADEACAIFESSDRWCGLSYGSGDRYRKKRPVTRFEARAIREGRASWDLVARRA